MTQVLTLLNVESYSNKKAISSWRWSLDLWKSHFVNFNRSFFHIHYRTYEVYCTTLHAIQSLLL